MLKSSIACAAVGIGLVLTACQTSGPVDRAQLAAVRLAAAAYGDEGRDQGVPPQNTLRSRDYHAPTPPTAPGARTITTPELKALMASDCKGRMKFPQNGRAKNPQMVGGVKDWRLGRWASLSAAARGGAVAMEGR